MNRLTRLFAFATIAIVALFTLTMPTEAKNLSSDDDPERVTLEVTAKLPSTAKSVWGVSSVKCQEGEFGEFNGIVGIPTKSSHNQCKMVFPDVVVTTTYTEDGRAVQVVNGTVSIKAIFWPTVAAGFPLEVTEWIEVKRPLWGWWGKAKAEVVLQDVDSR